MAKFFRYAAIFGNSHFAWPRLQWPVLVPDEDPQEAHARMDFVKEMMQACPEAFASEQDSASATLYISGRF